MLRHVWVTRPQPGATQTAKRLTALGFEPLIAPLTEIVGVDADLSKLSECAVVVFTSANGARFFPTEAAKALIGKPVFAVGEATAEAVRALGFKRVEIGPGDAATLACLIANRTSTNDMIGYIAGQQRTGTLEQALGALKRSAVVVEIYTTKKVSQITYSGASFFQTDQDRAVMIYSALSAQVMVSILAENRLPQNLDKAHYIAISQRVSDVLAYTAGLTCAVAGTPDEAGMIAALKKVAKPQN